MGWLKDNLGGLLGTLGGALGGPIGGFLGGAVGNAVGGGEQQVAPMQQAPTSGGSFTDTLAKMAFMRGYQDQQAALTGQVPGQQQGQGQTFSEHLALQGPQGMTRTSQQAGGQMAIPYGGVQRQPAGLGGGGGGDKGTSLDDYLRKSGAVQTGYSANPTAPVEWGQAQPGVEDLYRRQQSLAMSGQSTLPMNVYQGAVARGQSGVNQQAIMARQQLQNALARRGMSNSGALSTGLAGIERGRLGALGDLYGGLEQQQLAATRAAQQNAMNLYAQERTLGQGQTFQDYLQQQAYEQNQPGIGDYAAGLFNAYMGYRGTQGADPNESLLKWLQSQGQAPGGVNGLPAGGSSGYWGTKPKY